tara:strand:- start:4269 stop:4499 length:231 start_codon:yes stop_codon:yes gene_type:complete
MSYGKVISGGKQMTAGLTKNINKKLESFADSHKYSKMLATAVGKTFNQNPLSDQHLNNINVAAAKKFTTPKLPSKV